MRRLRTLTVPAGPEAVAEGVYWLLTFHGCQPKGGLKPHLNKILREKFALGDEAETFRVLHRAFKRARGKAPWQTLRKAHPHYWLWFVSFRAACVRRAKVWAENGLPGGKPYDEEVVASLLGIPGATLRRFMLQAEGDPAIEAVPEVLDKSARKAADNDRRVDFREATAKLRDNGLRRPKLEAMAVGASKKAGDVDIVPRKHRLDDTAKAGVAVEGGQIVISSGFDPHEGQRAFMNSGARFRFVVAGIRGGKTRAGAEELVRHALTMAGSFGWVVGPTYGMLEVAKRAILTDTILGKRRDLLAEGGYLKRENRLHFANGSVVEFKSAEWEDTLRGSALDFGWVDEAQMIKESAWKILLGRTSDTQGRLWCTGTPLGRNWLYKWWSKGGDAAEGDVEAFRFPSTMNPLVTDEEVERMRRSLPEAWWRQEYQAEFLSAAASVFGDLDAVTVERVPSFEGQAHPGVVLGVDVARKHDYSAIIALTSHGQVLEVERFNRVSWTWQRERIVELAARWGGCPVVVDTGGVGDPFIEDLINAGIDAHGMCTGSAVTKRNLIEQLMLDIEGRRMWLPRLEERLLYELKIYRRNLTASGSVTFAAPSGEHDDTVIALALANWGVRRLHLANAPAEVCEVASEPRAPDNARGILWGKRQAVDYGNIGQRRRGLFN